MLTDFILQHAIKHQVHVCICPHFVLELYMTGKILYLRAIAMHVSVVTHSPQFEYDLLLKRGVLVYNTLYVCFFCVWS